MLLYLAFLNPHHLAGFQSLWVGWAALDKSDQTNRNLSFSNSFWAGSEADTEFWGKWNAFGRLLYSCKHWKMRVGSNSRWNHRTPAAESCSSSQRVPKWGMFPFLNNSQLFCKSQGIKGTSLLVSFSYFCLCRSCGGSSLSIFISAVPAVSMVSFSLFLILPIFSFPWGFG